MLLGNPFSVLLVLAGWVVATSVLVASFRISVALSSSGKEGQRVLK